MRLRRRPVPEAVSAVALPAGERRAAWALTADGAAVVATERRLLLPGGADLPWEGVERVSWKRPSLLVVASAEVEGTGAQHRVELVEEGDLPELVRSRVTASVAWSRHERLSPSGGVRVVGRRRPGSDDLDWQLVYDTGTPLDDPLVREQAEQLLLSARRSIG